MTKHKKGQSSERARLRRGGGDPVNPALATVRTVCSKDSRRNTLHNPAMFASTERRCGVTSLGTSKKSEEKLKEGAKNGLGGGAALLEGAKAVYGMKNSMKVSSLFPMKPCRPQTSIQRSVYLPWRY